MDTKKGKAAGVPDVPADPRSGTFIAGAKQLRKALLAGRAKQVFLSKDADPAITEPLEQLCAEKNVPCRWVRRMSDLGAAAGIDVGAAAAAIVA